MAEMAVKNAPEDCGAVTPSASLTGISISGPTEVAENTQTNYIATAAYRDDTTREVTTLSLWQVNESSYAEMVGNRLSTFGVPADQQVLLTATYEEDGITRSSTLQVTILDQSIPLEGSHANRFSAYEGTSTCLACHTTEAMAVHASVHYQWKGNASETVGLKPGDAGKLGGINDFCIYPDTTKPGTTVLFRSQVDVKRAGGIPMGLLQVAPFEIIPSPCLGVAIETASVGRKGDVHCRL